MTYATASGVADALEGKQLIARAPLPNDQRVVTLSLTDAGEAQANQLENMLDEIEAAINDLPDTDQAALFRTTQTIVARLQQSGYVRMYEMCWGCQFFRRNAYPDDPHGSHHCAFVDAPLTEPVTLFECPDFVPSGENREVEP